jgi:hypothetical protein
MIDFKSKQNGLKKSVVVPFQLNKNNLNFHKMELQSLHQKMVNTTTKVIGAIFINYIYD